MQTSKKDFTLSKSAISALYVSLFGRSGEGSGNYYWRVTADKQGINLADVANSMLNTEPSKDFFGDAINTNLAFVEHIYSTTLNKEKGEDAEGKGYWVNLLDNGLNRGKMVTELIKAALNPIHMKSEDASTREAHLLLVNKIKASNSTANIIYKLKKDKENKEEADKMFKTLVRINQKMKGDSLDDGYIRDTIKNELKNTDINLTMLDNALSESNYHTVVEEVTGIKEEYEYLNMSGEIKIYDNSGSIIIGPKEYFMTEKEIHKAIPFFENNIPNIKKVVVIDKQDVHLSPEIFEWYPDISDMILKENKISLTGVGNIDKKLIWESNVTSVKMLHNQMLDVSLDETLFLIESKKMNDGSLAIRDTLKKENIELAFNPKIGYFKLEDDVDLNISTDQLDVFINKISNREVLKIKDNLSNLEKNMDKMTSINYLIKEISAQDYDKGEIRITYDNEYLLKDKFSDNIKYSLKNASFEHEQQKFLGVNTEPHNDEFFII